MVWSKCKFTLMPIKISFAHNERASHITSSCQESSLVNKLAFLPLMSDHLLKTVDKLVTSEDIRKRNYSIWQIATQ